MMYVWWFSPLYVFCFSYYFVFVTVVGEITQGRIVFLTLVLPSLNRSLFSGLFLVIQMSGRFTG